MKMGIVRTPDGGWYDTKTWIGGGGDGDCSGGSTNYSASSSSRGYSASRHSAPISKSSGLVEKIVFGLFLAAVAGGAVGCGALLFHKF